MASSTFSSVNSTSTTTLLVLFLSIFFGQILQCSSVASSHDEFQVGGPKGWVVPPSNDTNTFNNWASHNRFQVGDSIRFKYKKDSVMEVGEEGYKDCNATQPTFFSNSGDTVFRLEHSGTFYFISGASGHCEKGQKMIVRVMVQDLNDKSSGHHVLPFSSPTGVSKMLFLQFVLAFFASYVI